MAFDAATYAAATAESVRDILAPAVLRALSADKAQALYDLAAQVDHPKVWKLAAHALAGSLARLLAEAAQPGEAISPTAKPKRQSAPRLAAGDDLAAPLADPPRNKTSVGDFHALWADGSVTYVSGVIYHTGKPATRWAAAFQAADRLRRLRGQNAYETDLGRNATVRRQIQGACSVRQDSPQWLELNRLRPMPALLAIGEAHGDVFNAPTGSAYGAGDAVAARAIEAHLCTPAHPIGQSAPMPTAWSLKRQLEINSAPDFYAATAEPVAAPATGRGYEPCDLISLSDLDGQTVIIDAERVEDTTDWEYRENLRVAVGAAESLIKTAESQEEDREFRAEAARLRHALHMAQRAKEVEQPMLLHAGDSDAPTLHTLHRGIGGRTFDLVDSNGHRVTWTADLVPFLRLARPAQPLRLAA